MFLMRIQGRLVQRNTEDRLMWKDSKDGKLLVKSFYAFWESERGGTFLVEVVWNSWVTMKPSLCLGSSLGDYFDIG